MMSLWQKKTLTLCVSAAIAQCWAVSVRADSAVGTNTTLGNALNPNGLNTVPARDPEVVDAKPDERTPTGKLIGWPTLVPTRTKTASGWEYNGEAELGWMYAGGNTGSWWYNQYKDLPTNGLYLNNFYFLADQTERGTGYFVEALGGGVGYRDQFEGVNFGQYNKWKAQIFYNEIPHTFTTTYRSLWTGVDSEYLALSGLRPGGVAAPANARLGLTAAQASSAATTKALQDKLANTDYSELSLLRQIGGFNFETYLTNQWKLWGRISNEHRTGERPFAAVFGGGGGGGNVELPEPIDYDTTDVYGGVRFDDGVNNLNVQIQYSQFKNNISTLTFENPLYVNGALQADPTTINIGQFDLYPDNEYWNLRGEYARSFPDWYNSRLTATISLSKFQQDDNLMPWTPYSMQGIVINGVNAANQWNTTSALTKQSADAEIDTQMFDIGFVMRPTTKLDVNAKFRYYATDNNTDFIACNPLTGQWGRLYNNGTANNFAVPFTGNLTAAQAATQLQAYNKTGCDIGRTEALNLVPNVANVNIRSTPYQYNKSNFELGGDYKISSGQTVNLKYMWEQWDRDYREVKTSDENAFRLGYVNRAFSFGTLRASLEYGQKRGDNYIQTVYDQFEAPVLGPLPGENSQNITGQNVATFLKYMGDWRKFDVADRDRMNADVRFDWIAMHDLDVGFTGNWRDYSYPDSEYGRADNQRMGSGTIDINWQPSAKYGLTAYYTYATSHVKQYWMTPGGAGGGCVIGTTYWFYSDGTLSAGNTPLAGKSVIGSRLVNSGNWEGVCDTAGELSPLWPVDRSLAADMDDTNNAFGLTGRYDAGFARFELDGTYIKGTTKVGYNWDTSQVAPTGAVTGGSPAVVAGQLYSPTSLFLGLAGDGQQQDYNQTIVNFNVLVPITKKVAIRGLYRYEQGSIDDFHYNGVAANPVPASPYGAQAVYLDSGPQDYHTNTVGLLVQVTF